MIRGISRAESRREEVPGPAVTPVSRGDQPGRQKPPARGESVAHRWAQSPGSVGAARRHLRETLRDWELLALADESVLVLSELLTNAVEHSRNPDRTVRTHFSRLPGGCGVRIEVHDADTAHLPCADPAADEDAVRGRGLRLVAACTRERWGVVLMSGSKAVWGEVTR